MDMRQFGLSEEDLRQLGYEVGDGDRGDDGSAPGTASLERGQSGRRPLSSALRIWMATIIVLPTVAWASSLQRGLPDPMPATGPDSAFSSARALAQLVEVAQRPHPTGSPDLVRVRSTLIGRLNALGLDPEVQVATSHVRDEGLVRAATVRNVVARIPGTASTGTLALIAHYDAAPLSPGAGDNALGVATLLETVRTLLSGDRLRNDVIVVFTDGDELGLLGARAFAEQHPWASDVALTVSFESRGTTGPALLFEALDGNGTLVAALATAEGKHTASSLGRTLRRFVLESSQAEGQAGRERPSVALTVLGGGAWEDQPRDDRELVSERTLQHGGQQLLALVRGLAGLDLRRELTSPEQTYLSVPLLGFVHYSSRWNTLVTIVLVASWGLIGLVIRRRRGTRRGILLGLAFGGAAVGASALAASSLLGAIGDLHPETGLLATAFYRSGPHVLALAALALAVTSILYAVIRRWSRLDEVLFGALATPLALVLWLTFATPAAAPSVQWPLALALLAAILLTLLGPRRARSTWTWGAILLLSAATLALAVPSLELMSRARTLLDATTLGALFGVTTLLILPIMDWLRRPKVWATPLTALAAAATFVTLYLPSVQGAVDHPEPTTLVYLTDEVASPGPVLRGVEPEGDGSGVRTVLGKWLTVPGPGEQWAHSWVGDPPTGSTDPGVLLLGPDSLYEVAGTAPDARVAPPTVRVTSSTLAGGRRELALEVRSGLRGEMMGVIAQDERVEFMGVGGTKWPQGGAPVRRVVHWGAPEGGGMSIGLSLPADGKQTELVVIEHHLRPKEVLGDYFFQRADSMIANATMGSDRIIQRTRVIVEVPAEARWWSGG